MEIVAQQMVTDMPSSFERSFLDLAGVEMSRQAALECYRTSGLTPRDTDVLEVHDCFSCNEVRPPFFLTCPNSPHPHTANKRRSPLCLRLSIVRLCRLFVRSDKIARPLLDPLFGLRGTRFLWNVFEPFKKIAARVLLGLQTQGVAARFLNIS